MSNIIMYQAYNFSFTVLGSYNTFGRNDNKHFFIERPIAQTLEIGPNKTIENLKNS